MTRAGLIHSFAARLTGREARQGNRAKRPDLTSLQLCRGSHYTGFAEVVARVSSTVAENTYESGSSAVGLRSHRFSTLSERDIPAIRRLCLATFMMCAGSLGLFHAPSIALAQHPVDVQRLTAEGDHFRALAVYELLPERRMVSDTHIAAAKSAWALGLTKHATGIFDAVLRGDSLSVDDRARITLSRGIIEYQEQRFQEASLFAERAAAYLPEKAPLRGRALLLWGQSLLKLTAYASAEEKLNMALAEAAPSDRPEVYFALGAAQIKLGKLSDAERAFKGIPADHSRAAEAVRALASISLQTEQHDRARFWIEKGRSSYPEAFLDSWAEYGLAQVALRKGDMATARSVAEQAQRKFPSSDAWLILMQGALEQAEWSNARKEQR